MICPFCNIETRETVELCWKVGQDVKREQGEFYAIRHTCPRCNHYERDHLPFQRKIKK